MKRDLGTISAKVLTTRLRELEKRGVVARKVLHTSPPTVEYSLTVLGLKLNPILSAIAEVGAELNYREAQGARKPLPEKMKTLSAV